MTSPWTSLLRRLLGGVVVGSLALLVTGTMAASAVAAEAIDRTEVALGVHRFGDLAKPEAIVATAGPKDVGYEHTGEGPDEGPWSFDVARDGSVWLLDQFNYRLLVWEPGKPDRPARAVPLPQDVIGIAADLALGRNGTIYLSYVPVNPSDDRKRLMVCALSPTGAVLWTAPTDIEMFNSHLRVVPDGSVYWEGVLDIDDEWTPGTWTPVTSPDGEPLSLAEQRAGASPYQPMPGGLRFEGAEAGRGIGHHWNLTLLDQNGAAIGAWRVTSQDDLGGMVDEPGTVGGDPVVTFGVARPTPDAFLYEFVTIRLPVSGASPTEISLDPHAVRVDVPTTGLRVGPDGRIYQLRSDLHTGVSIAAYGLGAVPAPTPKPSPSSPPPPGQPSVRPPATVPPTARPVSAPVAPPAATPSAPIPPRHVAAPGAVPPFAEAGSRSPGRWVAVSLIVFGLTGLGTWIVVRRQLAASNRVGRPT